MFELELSVGSHHPGRAPPAGEPPTSAVSMSLWGDRPPGRCPHYGFDSHTKKIQTTLHSISSIKVTHSEVFRSAAVVAAAGGRGLQE